MLLKIFQDCSIFDKVFLDNIFTLLKGKTLKFNKYRIKGGLHLFFQK